MPKCSRVGCSKEATRHSHVYIGGMFADVWACDDHFEAVVESLKQ